jgi:hypothetical protein
MKHADIHPLPGKEGEILTINVINDKKVIYGTSITKRKWSTHTTDSISMSIIAYQYIKNGKG